MSNASTRSALLLRWVALWMAILAPIAVYWPGLDGDFLFDDNPHIVRNELVQIDSLSPEELRQAWNSSPFNFPNSRPLAMLTFGINHAVSGLSPFAFKATNLALHLVAGLLIYFVARRLARLFLRAEGRNQRDGAVRWWAWLTTALWLLHPLNLSPVLLSVQRMTVLSTLFVLVGMLVYLVGRQRQQDGDKGGLLWIWASPLLAVPGLLAKENAVLLPLLLFVMEWTLLRFRGLDGAARHQLWLFFLIVTALPILGAGLYLISHPGYLGFVGRPFDLVERVLTQTRVLWFYVRMLLAPDTSAMGLFHDDFVISRSLVQPWTTLLAVVALAATTLVAILLRKRLPLLSFAVLFFLAGHALESSVFPLELVYEHRNYLPAIAPLFAVAYLPTVGAAALPVSRGLLNLLVAAVVLAFSTSTAMRACDWSGFGRLIATEVNNHPDSPRSNFQYAQLLMEQVEHPAHGHEAANAARKHLQHIVSLNDNHADGIFGLIVLDLYQGRTPSQELVDQLTERLRRIPWNPLSVSTAQFGYLARWHEKGAPGPKLSREQVLEIFDAALANTTLPPVGRADILHALRAFHQRALGDIGAAVRYAELAVQAAPDNWELRDRYIRLLAATGRWDDAEKALQAAIEADKRALRSQEAVGLNEMITAARRGEPVPALPPERNQRANGVTR